MTKDDLAKIRNMLLLEAKKEKSEEYKSGYIDGALDMYNKSIELFKPDSASPA